MPLGPGCYQVLWMSPDHSSQVKMTIHFPTLITCLWLNAVPLKSGKRGFADLPGTAAFVSQPLLSGLDLGWSFEWDSKSNSAPCWGEKVRSIQCPSKRSVPGWTSRFPPSSAHLQCLGSMSGSTKPPISSFSLSQIFWQTNSHPMKKIGWKNLSPKYLVSLHWKDVSPRDYKKWVQYLVSFKHFSAFAVAISPCTFLCTKRV